MIPSHHINDIIGRLAAGASEQSGAGRIRGRIRDKNVIVVRSDPFKLNTNGSKRGRGKLLSSIVKSKIFITRQDNRVFCCTSERAFKLSWARQLSPSFIIGFTGPCHGDYAPICWAKSTMLTDTTSKSPGLALSGTPAGPLPYSLGRSMNPVRRPLRRAACKSEA